MVERSQKKLILVIGATGAQGSAVIPAILAPSKDGTPSPYCVRAITRNTTSSRAKALQNLGVELFQGSFYDPATVAAALEGCYGAYVNTDGFTVGRDAEISAGIMIYEQSRNTKSMRHFVWSSLDYCVKLGNFNPIYRTDHYDSKGIVTDYLKAQESFLDDNRLTWTSLTSGVYLEMLNTPVCGPIHKRDDGTVVFASPVGDGYAPMIALKDLGWWTRYTLDHRESTSGKDLLIASDVVGWDYLAATFTKVTGIPAVHRRLTVDGWFSCLNGADGPVADEKKDGTTTRECFSGFWRVFRDSLLARDMDWIKSVHPDTLTLDKWMRETGYTGKMSPATLKNAEEGKAHIMPNREKCRSL